MKPPCLGRPVNFTPRPPAKLQPGCRWQAKSFSVAMKPSDCLNPCLECANNKYHGGNAEICDSCVKDSNFKSKEDNAKIAEVR